jgi:hypothetical protein
MYSFPKTMAAGLLLVGAGLLGSSCVDNRSSVFIYGVMNINSSQCLAQPDATAVLQPSGTLDRYFADGYQAALLVGSHLTQRGSRQQLRTETSRLEITRAKMTLYGTNNSVVSFETPATGLINPSDGTDAGLAAVFIRMVRAEDMMNLGPDGQIIARIKIEGTTLGGQDLESGDFDYPITVCTGCLVDYPAGAIDPTSGNCDSASDVMSTSTICFFGQDASFPCTVCAGTRDPVCVNPKNNPFITGMNTTSTP